MEELTFPKWIFYNGKNFFEWERKINLFNSWGYLWFSFKSNSYHVHKIVAINFIPNPENKPCVNHKNWIKTDIWVENLEWCTYSENNKHAYNTWLKKIYKWKDHWYYNKVWHTHNMLWKTWALCKNSKKIYQFDRNMNFIKEFSSAHDVERELWFTFGSICRVARWERPYHKWFIWKYER